MSRDSGQQNLASSGPGRSAKPDTSTMPPPPPTQKLKASRYQEQQPATDKMASTDGNLPADPTLDEQIAIYEAERANFRPRYGNDLSSTIKPNYGMPPTTAKAPSIPKAAGSEPGQVIPTTTTQVPMLPSNPESKSSPIVGVSQAVSSITPQVTTMARTLSSPESKPSLAVGIGQAVPSITPRVPTMAEIENITVRMVTQEQAITRLEERLSSRDQDVADLLKTVEVQQREITALKKEQSVLAQSAPGASFPAPPTPAPATSAPANPKPSKSAPSILSSPPPNQAAATPEPLGNATGPTKLQYCKECLASIGFDEKRVNRHLMSHESAVAVSVLLTQSEARALRRARDAKTQAKRASKRKRNDEEEPVSDSNEPQIPPSSKRKRKNEPEEDNELEVATALSPHDKAAKRKGGHKAKKVAATAQASTVRKTRIGAKKTPKAADKGDEQEDDVPLPKAGGRKSRKVTEEKKAETVAPPMAGGKRKRASRDEEDEEDGAGETRRLRRR